MRGMSELPEQPPIAVKQAIERVRSYRSWTATEMWHEIREALQEPWEFEEVPRQWRDKR